jgi:microfibrillar-associated protein 1
LILDFRKRQEQEELERIRAMTDGEREEYLNRPKSKEKSKQKFLQKYYHKGAFFMDDNEDIYKRNYSEPTGTRLVFLLN